MTLYRLICWFKGHKRGKRDNTFALQVGVQGYRCPRCGATWTRKVKL